MMFALIMVVVLAITGLIWLADLVFFKKRRPVDAPDPVIVEYSKSFSPSF